MRILCFLGEWKVKISGNWCRNRTLGQAFFVEFRLHDLAIPVCAGPLAAGGADPNAYPTLRVNAPAVPRLSRHRVINDT